MSLTLFEILSENQLSKQELHEPEQQLHHSICSHLTRLLNSRQGSLRHLPDYGIPDITEIYQDLPYSISRLTHAIKLTIEKYEPRLIKINITQHPIFDGENILRLQIQAQAITGERLQFDTYFTSSGRAKIGL